MPNFDVSVAAVKKTFLEFLWQILVYCNKETWLKGSIFVVIVNVGHRLVTKIIV